MSEFKKEERYIVVKIKKLLPEQVQCLRQYLFSQGIETVECVVVESDWPNYEHVWETVRQVAAGEWKKDPLVGKELYVDIIKRLVDRLEYWINREDTRGLSKSEYLTWLALGHNSKDMREAKALLSAGKETV